MRRKTLDLILTAGGAALMVILIVAGALLTWGYTYTNNQVRSELAAQHIRFSPARTILTRHSETYRSRSVILPYAGQEVLNGTQANAYAYKIQMDMYTLPFHGVYATLSAASRAHPTTKKLAALVTVSFKGTALRGLLLEAYAFGTFGSIAFWAAIASYCLAFVMLVLTGLGLWHIRRVPATAEFPKSLSAAPAAA